MNKYSAKSLDMGSVFSLGTVLADRFHLGEEHKSRSSIVCQFQFFFHTAL